MHVDDERILDLHMKNLLKRLDTQNAHLKDISESIRSIDMRGVSITIVGDERENLR